jgi:predicted secreted protein
MGLSAASLFDDSAAMESFLSEVCTPAWNARLDAGRPWPEAIESLAREFPAQRDLILAHDARWEEMLGGAIEGTVQIDAKLRDAGVPCYALSNWSAARFVLTHPRFPFLEWFEGIVISGDVGASKPDPAGSNPTTGFSWLEPEISETALVSLADKSFGAPVAVPAQVVGAAGTEYITLKATAMGTSTVVLRYSQPWLGGTSSEWTYTPTVTVR